MHATPTWPRKNTSAASLLNACLESKSAELTRWRCFNRTIGTIGVDVERTSSALDHLARDHDFLDALETRQIEHGLEQDAFEDRTQATRAGLALDRPAGDRAKRLVGEGQLDVLHFEQPLILLHHPILPIRRPLLHQPPLPTPHRTPPP